MNNIIKIEIKLHFFDPPSQRVFKDPSNDEQIHILIDKEKRIIDIKHIGYFYENHIKMFDINRINEMFSALQMIIEKYNWFDYQPNNIDTGKECCLCVKYNDGTVLQFTTTYNSYSMPEGWYDFGNIINTAERLYNPKPIDIGSFKKPRPKGSLIYLTCCFSDNLYKSYYYRTNDDTIEPGDKVIVPVGINDTSIAHVVKKDYYFEYNIPYPIEKTKLIISKNN